MHSGLPAKDITWCSLLCVVGAPSCSKVRKSGEWASKKLKLSAALGSQSHGNFMYYRFLNFYCPKWHNQRCVANVRHIWYLFLCSRTAGADLTAGRRGEGLPSSHPDSLAQNPPGTNMCKWACGFALCRRQIKTGLKGVIGRSLWLDHALPGRPGTKWPVSVLRQTWVVLHDWKCG